MKVLYLTLTRPKMINRCDLVLVGNKHNKFSVRSNACFYFPFPQFPIPTLTRKTNLNQNSNLQTALYM